MQKSFGGERFCRKKFRRQLACRLNDSMSFVGDGVLDVPYNGGRGVREAAPYGFYSMT